MKSGVLLHSFPIEHVSHRKPALRGALSVNTRGALSVNTRGALSVNTREALYLITRGSLSAKTGFGTPPRGHLQVTDGPAEKGAKCWVWGGGRSKNAKLLLLDRRNNTKGSRKNKFPSWGSRA